MTREHKLALIVGFSLVLVVGVLISDHFSRARTSRVAEELAQETGGGLVPPSPAPTTIAYTPDGGSQGRQGAALLDIPLPPPVQRVASAPATVELTMDPEAAADGLAMGSPETQAGPTSGLGVERFPHAANVVTLDSVTEPVTSPVEPPVRLQEFVASAMREGLGGSADRAGNGAATTRAAGSSGAAGRVSTGTLRRHEVVKGDTLSKIAAKHYGDRHLWQRLQAFNGKRVAADGTVRIGATLLIPPKDVLLGEAVLSPDADAVPAREGKRPGAAPTTTPARRALADAGTTKKGEAAKVAKPEAGTRTYLVQRGDTLGAIAGRQLGSSGRWRDIFALNKGAMDGPNDLKAGMKIQLPAR